MNKVTENKTKKLNASIVALDVMVAIMRHQVGMELDSKVIIAKDGRTVSHGNSKIVHVGDTRVLFAQMGEALTWVDEDTMMHAHASIPLPTPPPLTWDDVSLLTQVKDDLVTTEWGNPVVQLRVEMDVPIGACYKLGKVLVGIDPTENGMELPEASELMKSVAYCMSFMEGGTVLEPV